ncbi:peptidase S8/S53 domain-containing protein [Zopfochytrium polystomum]|nr:peptidase S8/S53 domain-containing protein [Zopfochytrium polystomum]
MRTATDTDFYCGVSFVCQGGATVTAAVVANSLQQVTNPYQVYKRYFSNRYAGGSSQAGSPQDVHIPTGVNDTHAKLGLTGKGIKVAILDSGVYYKHPALGGRFGPGCKVAFGYDLVGDAFGSSVEGGRIELSTAPDSDPIDDCSAQARGTHLAGIVAGVGRGISESGFVPEFEWTGVAPEATIGAYRILGCSSESTQSDIVAAAIYKAAADGADVIVAGVFGGPSFSDEADAIAVERVSARGVVVVAPSGDSGDTGFMQTGNPAGALNGFGVTSYDPLLDGSAVASYFGSTGLDNELHIKPDIGAIGSNLYSCISPAAVPNKNGPDPNAYDYRSGTANAAAYFAGTLALYRQKRGATSFDEIRTAFQNTATPANLPRSNPLIDSVAKQGAGLVNVYRALTAKTVITPSILALNDSQYTSKTHYTLTLTNNFDKAVSYTFTHVPAVSVYMFDQFYDFITSYPSFIANYATLGFGNKQAVKFTVTVPAGASTNVNIDVVQPISINPPEAVDKFPIYSGFIRVTNNQDDSALSVPYAGMVGNWKDAKVLASLTGIFGSTTANGAAVISITYIATTTRLSFLEAIYVGSNQTVKNQLNKLGLGHGQNQGYLACYGVAPYFSSYIVPYGVRHAGRPNANIGNWDFSIGFVWNGTVVADPTSGGPFVKLPPGEYKIRLKALRHMTPAGYKGDENFDIVESGIIAVG